MNPTGPLDMPDSVRQVTILGVGLLGGSVAKALARLDSPPKVVGWGRTPDSVERLAAMGWLDEVTDRMESACRDSEIIVVASPVSHAADLVLRAHRFAPPGAWITDVGSTKAGMVADVFESPDAARRFVPAHPIAGSEKVGAEHAIADLFDDKVTIVTPHRLLDPALLDQGRRFWQSLGSRVVEMSPEDHDTHLAAISHVPHLASALVALGTPESALELVGSGWRDITRVAGGGVEMWTAIVRENRSAILESLDGMAAQLDQLVSMIREQNDDSLADWLSRARDIKRRADGRDC